MAREEFTWFGGTTWRCFRTVRGDIKSATHKAGFQGEIGAGVVNLGVVNREKVFKQREAAELAGAWAETQERSTAELRSLHSEQLRGHETPAKDPEEK